jgi:hypothetical protein
VIPEQSGGSTSSTFHELNFRVADPDTAGGPVAMHRGRAALVEGRSTSDRYITIVCPAKVCNDV